MCSDAAVRGANYFLTAQHFETRGAELTPLGVGCVQTWQVVTLQLTDYDWFPVASVFAVSTPVVLKRKHF